MIHCMIPGIKVISRYNWRDENSRGIFRVRKGSWVYAAFKLNLCRGNARHVAVEFFNLNVVEKNTVFQAVLWQRPPIDWIKLNIDSASKGNLAEAATGGIIRDSNSNFIYPFATYLHCQTSILQKHMQFLRG